VHDNEQVLRYLNRHGRFGDVQVDPATGRTALDGRLLAVAPAEQVSLSRPYFM
jgi:urease alpha subunit